VGGGDDGRPIAADFSSDSDILLIAFGGLKRGFGLIPPFEFFRLTGEVDTKKLYVRDMNQAWYHQGLPGIADNIDGVAVYLRDMIREQQPRKVVAVGNSAGGYAALLFGYLLSANIVLAFSPQTFISRHERALHGDDRWGEYQILNAHQSPTRQEKYFNLKRTLGAHRTRTKYRIYYQRENRLDNIHARRMRVVDNVFLHPRDEGKDDHHLVIHLRKNGALKKILMREL